VSDVFEKASVSSDLAHRIIAAAEAKATEIGVPMDIAVCDESGVLKAFSRMDGAALLSIQIAQDKAYTAVGFGLATDAWHDFVKNDPPLAMGAAPGIDRLIAPGAGRRRSASPPPGSACHADASRGGSRAGRSSAAS